MSRTATAPAVPPPRARGPRLSSAPRLGGVVVTAGLVIVCAGLKTVSGIVGPVFLVLTLVISVQPLRAWLVRRGLPRALGSVVALLAVYAALLLVLGSVVWSLSQLVTTLPQYADAFASFSSQVVAGLAKLGINQEVVTHALSSSGLNSLTRLLAGLLAVVSGGASLVALMLAMVFFLAFDGAEIDARMRMIGWYRPEVADALTDFSHSVRSYWVVTTAFGLAVAIIDLVALLVIGVPLAFAWGVLAFVTNYIPNVGFLLGLVPPVLIALLSGGLGAAIAVTVAYCLTNIVLQSIVQPRFTGNAVGITPTVAFISLIFWSYLLGALGALLAVPATLLVKSLLVDYSEQGRWVGALLSARPDPVDSAAAPADVSTQPTGH